MNQIKTLLSILRNRAKELQFIKILVIILINLWLLIIFWKILLIDGVNIVNGNMGLTKINTIIQPVLIYLGLDMLNPHIIKMLILTLIIITVNVTVLHFNQMVGIFITLGIARYGYKSYTNYLINQENMSYIGVQTPQNTIKEPIITKVVEQAPVIINTGASETNWWLWGTVIVVGVIAVAGIALTIWSHNTNANNMADLAEKASETTTTVRNQLQNIDQKTNVINSQVDLLFTNHGKSLDTLQNTNKLLSDKIENIENGLSEFSAKIIKVEEYTNQNMKLLSDDTLEISNEAKSFFNEVLQTTSATESIVLAMAKLLDGFTILEDRINVMESKVDSLTGSVTPRYTQNIFNSLKQNTSNPDV